MLRSTIVRKPLADISSKEDVSNKTSDYTLNNQSAYPNSKALHDGLAKKYTANAYGKINSADIEDWQPCADWPDIRSAALSNSIYLLAAHSADFTSYDNLGLKATVTGGYNVFIDGVQYGSTYASGVQCSITWSTSGIATGYDITTPSSLRAHIIRITPAVASDTLTAFRCARVAASGLETQGVLWAHFTTVNFMTLSNFLCTGNAYANPSARAITSISTLKTDNLTAAFNSAESLSYLPIIEYNNISSSAFFTAFYHTYALKKVTFKNVIITYLSYAFVGSAIEQIILDNSSITLSGDNSYAFHQCYQLKQLPTMNLSAVTLANEFLTYASSLQQATIFDLSGSASVTRLGIYGSAAYKMTNLKGLTVSSSAPFTGTSPQINVSYTGLERAALIALFTSFPTVSAGQIVNIVGATGAAALTAEDIAIANVKGWTVTR